MKKVVIVVVVVLALIIGGGVWFAFKAKQALNEHGIEVGKNGMSVDVNGTKVNVSGDGISADGADGGKASLKGSLVDMLSGSAALKCSVTDETGEHTVLAKAGKVRIDGVGYDVPGVPAVGGESKKGTMIVTEDMFYMWSGQEGMKWNIKEMEELNRKMDKDGGASSSDEGLSDMDWAGWAKEMEASGAKYDCSPSVVTDADFTPPADVQFQDFGEFMKQFGAGFQGQAESQMDFSAAGQVDLSQLGAFPQ